MLTSRRVTTVSIPEALALSRWLLLPGAGELAREGGPPFEAREGGFCGLLRAEVLLP